MNKTKKVCVYICEAGITMTSYFKYEGGGELT